MRSTLVKGLAGANAVTAIAAAKATLKLMAIPWEKMKKEMPWRHEGDMDDFSPTPLYLAFFYDKEKLKDGKRGFYTDVFVGEFRDFNRELESEDKRRKCYFSFHLNDGDSGRVIESMAMQIQPKVYSVNSFSILPNHPPRCYNFSMVFLF